MNKLNILEKNVCIIVVLFFLLGQNSALAINANESTFAINFPMQINLKELEDKVNASFPMNLVDINEKNKVCVKAKWLKTKIPLISKWIKTKITPEIKCDVSGWVKRNGRITVSGNKSKLRFALPIKAKVTAKALIQETAKSEIIVYIEAKPTINNDWSFNVDIGTDFKWEKKPTIWLFGIIKITFASKVERKIYGLLNDLEAKVPESLTDIQQKLKEKRSLWSNNIQEPFKAFDSPDIFVRFKPSTATYTGFMIEGNILQTTINLAGKIFIQEGEFNNYLKTDLPDIQLTSVKESKSQFFLTLPVNVPYKRTVSYIEEKYSNLTFDLDDGQKLQISNFKFEEIKDKEITISTDIKLHNETIFNAILNFFGWGVPSGKFIIKGTLSSDENILKLNDFTLSSKTDNKFFDSTLIQQISNKLNEEKVLQYDYSSKVDEIYTKAKESFNELTVGNLKISGSLQKFTISSVEFNEDHITIKIQLTGEISADIDT